MNSSVGAAIATYVLFTAIGIMGAWDGLVRRRIRIRRGIWYAPLNLRGLPAILVGILCLFLLLLLFRLAVPAVRATVTGCNDPLCAVSRVVVPPFTNPIAAIVIVTSVFVFAMWLAGIKDHDGPFRSYLLAPGVWYHEREVVALVQQREQKAHKTSVEVDTILAASDRVLRVLHGVSPTMDRSGPAGEPLTRDSAIRWVVRTAGARRRNGSAAPARPFIVETIAGYAIDRLEAAERRWPWRRRLLTILP